MPRILRLAICVIVLALPSSALAIPIDFESLSDSTELTNQLPGMAFTNATVLSAGISLNEFDFPPLSGSNVVYDAGGPMSIAFDAPLASFGGYFTYVTQLTLQAFSPAHLLLGSITSAFSSNFASGGVGTPNEFLQVAFASGIGFVTITGDAGGGSFVLDDAILTAKPTDPAPPVPEPGTLGLMLLGVAAWRTQRARARRLSWSN